MPKLTEYNGKYCEADFEYAFLTFLENAGWTYSSKIVNADYDFHLS